MERNHRLRQSERAVEGDNENLEENDDNNAVSFSLDDNEENVLNYLIWQVMNGEKPDLSQLNQRQLDKFIVYVELLEKLLRENDGCTYYCSF